MKKQIAVILILILLLSMINCALAEDWINWDIWYEDNHHKILSHMFAIDGTYANRLMNEHLPDVLYCFTIDENSLAIEGFYWDENKIQRNIFHRSASDNTYDITMIDENNNITHLEGTLYTYQNAINDCIFVENYKAVTDAFAAGGKLSFFIQNAENFFEFTCYTSKSSDQFYFPDAWKKLTGKAYRISSSYTVASSKQPNAPVPRELLETLLTKVSTTSDCTIERVKWVRDSASSYHGCVMEYNGINPYVQIPSLWSEETVSIIFNKALYQEKIIDVLLPDTLKLIMAEAFRNSGIQAIYIPNGVESIALEAFAYCENLHTVVIPPSVSAIGKNAFAGCNPSLLLKVQPDSFAEEYCWEYGLEYTYYDEAEEQALAKARSKILYECDGFHFYFTDNDDIVIVAYPAPYYDLVIPDQFFGHPVVGIDSYAFYGEGIGTATIPASVVSIGEDVFEGCRNLDVFYVYENSYAEQYCKDNNLPYEIIERVTSVEVKVKSNVVHLRNRKGSSIVGIPAGKSFYITGYDSASGLFTAEYNNQTGYVKGTGLNISKDELLGYFK